MAVGAEAHSLSPGYKRYDTVYNNLLVHYTLINAYPFPASYTVGVYNKDWTPHKEWSVEKATYNLNPTSERPIIIAFTNIQESRKVIVCTTLTGITHAKKPPKIVSRACSRLYINYIPS